MIDGLYLALNDTATTQMTEMQAQQQKNSIGLIHQKMTKRYQVVKVLPKKADNWDEMFQYADAYGKIRFGYFAGRFDEETTNAYNSFASAVGGILGVHTAAYKGVRLNAAMYISQDLPFAYDTNKRSNDFYTADGKSYAYLAEASIEYSSDYLEAKIGRIAIDLPYANTDDIRMSQNTFEGGWGVLHYNDKWSSQVFYLTRWAGYDSSDDDVSQNEFKKLVEDGNGMAGVSIAYKYDDESDISLWYNYIDKMASIVYAEINGVYNINKDMHFDYGLQAAHIMQEKDSHVDGDVYGAMFIGHYQDFFLGAAANFALVDSGDSVTDGFGGGPYFTSLDEATIAGASELAPGENIDMYRVSTGYDLEAWHSSFEYAYGYMSCDDNYIREHDLVYTYNLDDKWEFQAVGANFKMQKSDNKFNRFVARLDYNF